MHGKPQNVRILHFQPPIQETVPAGYQQLDVPELLLASSPHNQLHLTESA